MDYLKVLNIIQDNNVDLRHDVDISIEMAYQMAVLEMEMGVKSTYYIRFDCDYYNPLSNKNKPYIDFINNYHEIGCHVDVVNVKDDFDLTNYLNYRNKLIPFTKFTFHKNTDFTKSFTEIDGYENMSILKTPYISDSRGVFSIDSLVEIKNNPKTTLLIHPEWWVNDDWKFTDNPEQTLIILFDKSRDELISRSLNEILPHE